MAKRPPTRKDPDEPKKGSKGRRVGAGEKAKVLPPKGWTEAARQAKAKKRAEEKARAEADWRRQALREHKKKVAEEARLRRLEDERREREAEQKREREEARRIAEGQAFFTPKKRKKRGPSKPRVRETYAARIKRLMDRGFTRAQARGHARKKVGELGIAFGRKLDKAVAQTKGEPARYAIRAELLSYFNIKHFEAEREFVEERVRIDGLKGPRDWHRRRQMYEKIAAHLERLFGTERNEAFSLLFSP